MEQFITTFAISALGAFFIKLLDHSFVKLTQKQNRVEGKVDLVLLHLNDYGALTQMWRLLANLHQSVVKDEKGEWIIDEETGKGVLEGAIFYAKPERETAFRALLETDVRGGINQKIIEISLDYSNAADALFSLDETGELVKQLDAVYLKTVTRPEHLLNLANVKAHTDNFIQFVERIEDADNARRELRREVSKCLH